MMVEQHLEEPRSQSKPPSRDDELSVIGYPHPNSNPLHCEWKCLEGWLNRAGRCGTLRCGWFGFFRQTDGI